MNYKKLYLGQEIEQEDWSFGLGSMYLAGPRNPKGKSWRLEFIEKVENIGTPVSFFIPETKSQLKGGFNKSYLDDVYDWQHMAISLASIIVFWYPVGVIDTQSYVEFGAWSKSERIFVGRENNHHNQYIDWLLHKEQKLFPAESMDELVDMVIHWLKE